MTELLPISSIGKKIAKEQELIKETDGLHWLGKQDCIDDMKPDKKLPL